MMIGADPRMSKLSESKAVCIVPPGAGYLDIKMDSLKMFHVRLSIVIDFDCQL
jgi:hypothetical protein